MSGAVCVHVCARDGPVPLANKRIHLWLRFREPVEKVVMEEPAWLQLFLRKLEPMTGLVWLLLVLTQIFGSSDSIQTTVSSEAADLMEPFLRSFSQSETLAAECRRLGPFAFLALFFRAFILYLRETCSQEQPL